ncbi:MAG: choice-of-anchor X domain-containing protein, partial [bacterium]
TGGWKPEVDVEIVRTDSSLQPSTLSLRLFDDGLHADYDPNDGYFANKIMLDKMEGQYDVKVAGKVTSENKTIKVESVKRIDIKGKPPVVEITKIGGEPNSGAVNIYTTQVDWVLSSGDHVIEITVKDAAGNESAPEVRKRLEKITLT